MSGCCPSCLQSNRHAHLISDDESDRVVGRSWEVDDTSYRLLRFASLGISGLQYGKQGRGGYRQLIPGALNDFQARRKPAAIVSARALHAAFETRRWTWKKNEFDWFASTFNEALELRDDTLAAGTTRLSLVPPQTSTIGLFWILASSGRLGLLLMAASGAGS